MTDEELEEMITRWRFYTVSLRRLRTVIFAKSPQMWAQLFPRFQFLHINLHNFQPTKNQSYRQLCNEFDRIHNAYVDLQEEARDLDIPVVRLLRRPVGQLFRV